MTTVASKKVGLKADEEEVDAKISPKGPRGGEGNGGQKRQNKRRGKNQRRRGRKVLSMPARRLWIRES